MRRLLVVMCLATVGSGCVSDKGTVVSTSAWAERLKPKPPEATSNVVELHYIFIEREAGNELIEKTIWAEADELVVPLERKREWESNGLRLGKLGSQLTPDILKLLEASNPTGEGRRHITQSGGMVKVQMTDNMPVMHLLSMVEGKPRGEEIADAQGCFHITASATASGGVHLAIHPAVEHGPVEHKWTPAPDLSGMQRRSQRATKAFPELAMELELGSGEYVLLGKMPGDSRTLGDHFFSKQVRAEKKVTVLLIRAIRPTRDELYSSGNDFDDFFLTPIHRNRPTAPSNIRETVLAARRTNSSL